MQEECFLQDSPWLYKATRHCVAIFITLYYLRHELMVTWQVSIWLAVNAPVPQACDDHKRAK